MRGKGSKARPAGRRSGAVAARRRGEPKPLRSSRPPRAEAAGLDAKARDAARSVVYEVRVHGQSLTGLRMLVGKQPAAGRACHDVIAGLAEPCSGCPALALARGGARRDTFLLPTASGPYRVAAVEPIGHNRFRLHWLHLGDGLVSELQHARVGRIARKAKLSDRELSVLDLLLLGRSSGEIGAALGITERTVRFHVANVLSKLQAESRADLLRLLL